MNHTLKNKRALVTGGSRGIGAAIVKRLASEGADVAFTYSSSPDKANDTAAAARSLGIKVIAIQADSADASAIVAAVERTVSELGGIDILVNSAGVLAMGPIDNFALADFDRTMAVNVRAVFVATQVAVKHMKEGGRIINIGSCNAERMPFQGGSVYAMSKSALQGLVQGLARDLGTRGITINNVQPGPIDTEMNPDKTEFAEMLKKQFMALPRYGTVEEVAAMVAYLAGPEAGYVTGASLTIDGGFNA
ncbi:MAG: 3-oxoacyl-ACP reductase FabG [Candidatus Competibacteraceae bacterium]|nr:MAG: 3-oxoacyl-ACP reductase FabG [Candidatus Competibacteraceae bacterium]